MKSFKTLRFFILFAIALTLNSCVTEPLDSSLDTSNNNTTNSSGIYKWSFKLDGVLYQWEGTLQNPGNGGGTFNALNNKGILSLTRNSPLLAINIQFPSLSTGNFTFNSTNPATEGFTFIKQNQNLTSETFTTAFGGTMNVNISSLSPITLAANPTNPGKVIGAFSGTIKKGGSTVLYTITEGIFEVPRIQ